MLRLGSFGTWAVPVDSLPTLYPQKSIGARSAARSSTAFECHVGRATDCTDEHGVHCATLFAQERQDTWIESQPEVLACDAFVAKPLDELG